MSRRIILNWSALCTSRARKMALSLVEEGISRVLPNAVMASAIAYDRQYRRLTVQGEPFDLSSGRLFVIGGGKASALMAQELERIVGGETVTAGIVTTKAGDSTPDTKTVRILPAGHPVPDERGISAVKGMLDLKSAFRINERDTVLCLISGGGSALMPSPLEAITLAEKQAVTALLLSCGAEISEINSIRKHLSMTKGGRLGQYFAPATVVSLILSDVIGNDLSVIASGPTEADPSTYGDAIEVLEKYGLTNRAPPAVLEFLRKGLRGEAEETPKVLTNCHNFIIGDNRMALEAMKQKALELGLRPLVITAEQKGETGEVARSRANEIMGGQYDGFDVLLIGGETTPRLPPEAGKGGRNQHFAAVSMLALAGYAREWVVASVGTDGSDFLPDVAGAIVDDATLSRLIVPSETVRAQLDRYDSYSLLAMTPDSLVKTGNTGTNVGDVVVYVIAARAPTPLSVGQVSDRTRS